MRAESGDRVVVSLRGGEAYVIDPTSGAAAAVAGFADRWTAAGDLVVELGAGTVAGESALRAYRADGAERMRASFLGGAPGEVAVRAAAPAAPVAVSYRGLDAVGGAVHGLAVFEPGGRFTRNLGLAADTTAFTTVVDGAPTVGLVLVQPLAVVLLTAGQAPLSSPP
jgi:hypothetical protein